MEEKELFHFENNFDIDTYDRLQNFYISVIQKPNIIALLAFYIISIIAFVYGIIFLKADIKSYLIIEGIFTAFILIVFLYPRLQKKIHKCFIKSKFHKENRKQEFSFYGDYFIVKEGKVEGKYKYLNVFKVYETNDDFFFRVNKNIAFILPKDKVSNLEKLEEFLAKKFQHRFIKKYNKIKK